LLIFAFTYTWLLGVELGKRAEIKKKYSGGDNIGVSRSGNLQMTFTPKEELVRARN
jgi:hypothetical protein